MKQLLTVLKYELTQKLKEKSYLITIVITSLIFFGLTFVPRFFMSGDNSTNNSINIDQGQVDSINAEKDKVLLYTESGVSDFTVKAVSDFYDVTNAESVDDLKAKIENNEGDFVKGIILTSDLEATTVVKDQSFTNLGDDELIEILTKSYRNNVVLKEENISPESFEKAQNIFVNSNTEAIGRNGFAGYIISYIAIMFMYFTVLMNGQAAATNVAKEKDSRTMEILITNVSSKALIWGKVLSSFFATIIHFVILVIAVVIGYFINRENLFLIGPIISQALESLTILDILILKSFVLVGILMFYLLFASFASLVNKLDELSQVMSGVTIIIVLAFMVPMMSMSNPDSLVMRIASIVPFTSPLAIFPRMLMTSMPIVEVLASLSLLVATTVVISIVSVKIYRYGTLNYGNKLKIWDALFYKD